MIHHRLVIIWLIIISVTSVILIAVDKSRAKRNLWRIRESHLILTSLLGGSAAMYISMQIFRHKTRHGKFMIGLPVMIILQVAAAIGAVWYFGK